MTGLAERGLKSAAELAADRPHGTRMRYLGGCKCVQCRRANSDYERQRKAARLAGDWNGIVSARKARAHLRRLSKQGVGRGAVQAASDVAGSVIHEIISGRRTSIRARTERRILAVTKSCASDGALISATKTWWYIGLLIDEGYTKTYLAKQLGYAAALQFGKDRITVKNAERVRRLYVRLTT